MVFRRREKLPKYRKQRRKLKHIERAKARYKALVFYNTLGFPGGRRKFDSTLGYPTYEAHYKSDDQYIWHDLTWKTQLME